MSSPTKQNIVEGKGLQQKQNLQFELTGEQQATPIVGAMANLKVDTVIREDEEAKRSAQRGQGDEIASQEGLFSREEDSAANSKPPKGESSVMAQTLKQSNSRNQTIVELEYTNTMSRVDDASDNLNDRMITDGCFISRAEASKLVGGVNTRGQMPTEGNEKNEQQPINPNGNQGGSEEEQYLAQSVCYVQGQGQGHQGQQPAGRPATQHDSTTRTQRRIALAYEPVPALDRTTKVQVGRRLTTLSNQTAVAPTITPISRATTTKQSPSHPRHEALSTQKANILMDKLLIGIGKQVSQQTRTMKAKKTKALGLGVADSPYMQTVKVREAQLISNGYAKRNGPAASSRSPTEFPASLGNRSYDRAQTDRTDAKAWQKELYYASPRDGDSLPDQNEQQSDAFEMQATFVQARATQNIKMDQPAVKIEESKPEPEIPLQLFDLPKAKESAFEESVASALGTSPVVNEVYIQEFPEALRQVESPPDREILEQDNKKLETEPNMALQSVGDIPKSEPVQPKGNALSPAIAALVKEGAGSSLGGSSIGRPVQATNDYNEYSGAPFTAGNEEGESGAKLHENSGKQFSQDGKILAETRMSPEFLAERAGTASPGVRGTNLEVQQEIQAVTFQAPEGQGQRQNQEQLAEYGFDDENEGNPSQEQHLDPIGQEADATGAASASRNNRDDQSAEAELRAKQSQLEQRIIALNKKAMECMGREKLFGYGMVDEEQWQEQTRAQKQLVNTFRSVFEPQGSQCTSRRSPVPGPETSVFRPSRVDDLAYAKRRDAASRERCAREASTKVKVVLPTTLKSYQLLKEAETLLMSPECETLEKKARNNMACITLNNLGCFYKRLNFNKVALQHFELVLELEQALQATSVSLVSTMLNICANFSNQQKHKQALTLAERCLKCLLQEMQNKREADEALASSRNAPPERQGTRREAKQQSSFLKKQNLQTNLSANFWLTLQITHYNMAVELEHLHRYEEAIHSFEKAREISVLQLKDQGQELIKDIEKNLTEVKRKIVQTSVLFSRRRENRDRPSFNSIGQPSGFTQDRDSVQLRTRSSIATNLDISKMLSGRSVREDAYKQFEMNTARAPTNRDLWTQQGEHTANGVQYTHDDSRINTQLITARGKSNQTSRAETEGPDSSASATRPAEVLQTSRYGLRAFSTAGQETRRPAKKRAKSINSTVLATKFGGQSTSRGSKRPQALGAPLPEEVALKFNTLTGYFQNQKLMKQHQPTKKQERLLRPLPTDRIARSVQKQRPGVSIAATLPHKARHNEVEDVQAVRLPPRLFSPTNMLGTINSDIFGDRDRPMAAAPRSRGQLAAGRGCSPKFVTAGVLQTFTAEPTSVQRFGPGVLAHSSAFEGSSSSSKQYMSARLQSRQGAPRPGASNQAPSNQIAYRTYMEASTLPALRAKGLPKKVKTNNFV